MAVTKVVQVVNNKGVPFHVRLIRKGDYYGLNNGIRHDGNEPLVEFYDARHVQGFTILGQFVSRYLLSTLICHEGGLCLDGGVDDWYITDQNMKNIKRWLRNIKPYFKVKKEEVL
jgi:hypothetical protein